MYRHNRYIIWAAKGMYPSARRLQIALQLETDRKVLIIRSNSLRFKPRPTDIILNWGNSRPAIWDWWPLENLVLNTPDKVAIAINKLKTFQTLEGHCNIPNWTTNYEKVNNWVLKDKAIVLGRRLLTQFGGTGIEICNPTASRKATEYSASLDDLDSFKGCPLYVQYKKKKKEFRVHVVKGEVIDITQKRKRKDFDGEVNTKIRNHSTGWAYCRENIKEPFDLQKQATKAMKILGLDFGAVDIIWNEHENKSYVLEVNTAPGIEGTTLTAYKNNILINIT